jgi:hypothetical protein
MKFIIIFICSIIFPILSFKEIKPKLCINCKYFIKDNYSSEYGKCSYFPRIIEDDSFLVNGIIKEINIDYYYCSTMRGDENKCGKEGKIYKRKYNKNINNKKE